MSIIISIIINITFNTVITFAIIIVFIEILPIVFSWLVSTKAQKVMHNYGNMRQMLRASGLLEMPLLNGKNLRELKRVLDKTSQGSVTKRNHKFFLIKSAKPLPREVQQFKMQISV